MVVHLTIRQMQVLRGIANGSSSKEIGSSLNLSFRTIEVYTQQLLCRLNAKCRAHAVAIGFKEGILKPGDIVVKFDRDA